MNLWFRLLWLLLTAWRRPRLVPPRGVSVLAFRVWPTDLDLSAHMNNGRYWTLMDLGRFDLMLRSGLWKAVRRHRWMPVVTAAKIRFRREMRLFRPFRLETRIVAWAETWLVMEHRIVSKARDGSEVVAAISLVRAGLYDRAAKAFVPVDRMMAEVGVVAADRPPLRRDVKAFLDAETAMRKGG